MPTGSGPVVAAGWLALVLMAGYLLQRAQRADPVGAGGADLAADQRPAAAVQGIRIAAARRALARLGLGPALVALALWLVVNLIARNVGAVSATAPLFEANLLAMLPRVAACSGLPPPQSLGDLWARSSSTC